MPDRLGSELAELTSLQRTDQNIGLIRGGVNYRFSLSALDTLQSVSLKTRTVLSNNGNNTLTAEQFRGGIIEHSGMTADRTDTTPTAALLVADISGAAVGTSYEVIFANTDDTHAMIIGAGAGVTLRGDATIPFGRVVRAEVVFTNVTAAAEAVTIYMGLSASRLFPNGTAAAPAMAFADEPGTGLYKIASGNLDYQANGSLAARFAGEYILHKRNAAVSAIGTHRTDAHGTAQIGLVSFYGVDSGAATEEYAQIQVFCLDNTATSEDGEIRFSTKVAGAATVGLTVTKGSILLPIANVPNHADDAAAAAGGIAVGAIYRTASALKIRVS